MKFIDARHAVTIIKDEKSIRLIFHASRKLNTCQPSKAAIISGSYRGRGRAAVKNIKRNKQCLIFILVIIFVILV
jgi:hypothetical protein